MITQEQVEFIKEYVNEEFFDLDKLLEYLDMHQMVGNEIFNHIYKADKWKYNRKAYSVYLDDKFGYYALYKDSFIQRIPFYFYVPNMEMECLNHGSLNGVLSEFLSGSNGDNVDLDNLEELYQDLIYLYYKMEISLEDIFNYYINQTGYYNQGMFALWVKYVRLCEKLGETDYLPESLITKYNELLEKYGDQPIMYCVEYDIRDGIGYRDNYSISFEGRFPCDEDGKPIMKWIGIRVENEKDIRCSCKRSESGMLIVDIAPTTRIWALDDDDNGEKAWYSVYNGPRIMRFDYESLKYHRQKMGLTQKAIAEAIDANVRTYQKWESGKTTPDCQNLIRLMNWLNITDVQDVIKYE